MSVGVIKTVEWTDAVTVAVEKAEILPVPDAPSPVWVLSFVQLNVAPEGVLLKAIAAAGSAEQYDKGVRLFV